MSKAIRANLALLTLLAALTGAMLSSLFRDRMIFQDRSRNDFLRDVELSNKMPVIVLAPSLANRFNGDAAQPKTTELTTAADESVGVFVPDRYAIASLSCGTTNQVFSSLLSQRNNVWFSGRFSQSTRLFGSDSSAGKLDFRGSVFQCQSGHRALLASGFTLSIPVQSLGSDAVTVRAGTALTTYPAFVADLFVGFLLMIFVPTLTLSILKAIVDSADTERGTVRLFRNAFQYLTFSTLVAAVIGVSAGFAGYKLKTVGLEMDDLAQLSLGSDPESNDYVAHPILRQIGEIIPSNPLGALANPDGTKGLQIAFTAILIGLLLAVLDSKSRDTISRYLRKLLALVIRDRDLDWKSLSDWADAATPFGIFFVSLTFCATVRREMFDDILRLMVIIFVALAVHAFVLMLWIVSRRDWKGWIVDGLIPGLPGLFTALATSSSYAALPGITGVPLFAKDSFKRGVFDLYTALNKNGTTIYISSIAAYVLLQNGGDVFSLNGLMLLLLSGLASFATAGLPFAAVFGLRLVLIATGNPGSLAWLILPIDPLIDRFVTALNVFANLGGCSAKKGEAAEEPIVSEVDLRVPVKVAD